MEVESSSESEASSGELKVALSSHCEPDIEAPTSCQSKIEDTSAAPEDENQIEHESEGPVRCVNASEKETSATTMADEELSNCEPTSNDNDNPETDRTSSGAGDGESGGDVANNEFEDNDDNAIVTAPDSTGIKVSRSAPSKLRSSSSVFCPSTLSTVCEETDALDQDESNNKDESLQSEKVSGKVSRRKKPRKEPTKVVIRRLPPKITKEDFIESVSPLAEYDYLAVDTPDPVWGPNARANAHINFINPEDAASFIERFNKYMFMDEDGQGYTAFCDYAMIPKIIRSKKSNPLRATLADRPDFIEFMEKYNSDPFQFVIGVNPNEGSVVTPDIMLEELESRPKGAAIGETPLVKFILARKTREEEKKLSREREREKRRQERKKRDEERKKEKHKSDEMRKERRERKEREKKERRERERKDKIEKDAKAKGMTITYSKSGKATRWSVNSGPTSKKQSVKQSASESPTDADCQAGGDNNDKSVLLIKRGTDPQEEGNVAPKSTEVNPKKSNPFSKEYSKKPGFEDKQKFGRPFTAKTEVCDGKEKEDSPKSSKEPFKRNHNRSAPSEDKKSKPGEQDSSKDSTKPSKSEAEDGSSKGKKKIIKKIIRVKKKKAGEGDEGESSTVIETKVISEKIVSSSGVNNQSKSGEKKKEGKALEPKAKASNVEVAPETEGSNKKRRSRPEMQIYRPGSLRSGVGTSKSKPKYEKEHEKSEDSRSGAENVTVQNDPLTGDADRDGGD